MKHYASVIIFFALIITSGATSIGNYKAAEERIVADLNAALTQTLTENPDGWITNDTIEAYRKLQAVGKGAITLCAGNDMMCRHIKTPQLRDKTFICLDIIQDGKLYENGEITAGVLCSDTIIWKTERLNASVALRSYVKCSTAAIFGMSDQSIPLTLFLTALLWATAVWTRTRRVCFNSVADNGNCEYISGNDCITSNSGTYNQNKYYGRLAISDDCNCFYNEKGESIRLTPMQHELMRMFFSKPDYRLSKQEICDTLWPKKENASETLYTLIKRLKPVIEECSDLYIATERGRAYRLIERSEN